MKTIILCGGSGTRLWPISQDYRPKQFVKLLKNQSLFELTVERNQSFSDEVIVIVNSKQVELCKDQLAESKSKILIETIGRNTAPAVALAALSVDPEEIILVLPSDHLIRNQSEYEKCVLKAKRLAENGKLVTFGIKPTHPETGYGYIKADGEKVESFKEKPDLETAIRYLESKDYFWNSGMFCFKAKVFLDELKLHSPSIYNESVKVYNKSKNESDEIYFSKEDLLTIPSDSIDYAVMEKSSNVCVVPSDIDWSDLGSYDSLYENLDHDGRNSILSNGSDIHTINSKGNLIIGNGKTIGTFDVDDLIIVDSPEGILIGKKGSSQKVKDIWNLVKSSN